MVTSKPYPKGVGKFLRNLLHFATVNTLKIGSVPQRIAASLRREIGARFEPGEKLPGMHELKHRFGVSINTIGAALDMLAGEGLVAKKRGSGVYVTEQAAHRRIGILSELDLFDPRIGPHWRVLAGAVKTGLEAAGDIPHLYVGNAEPGPGASDEPTCPRFWEDAAAGKLDAAVILDVPSSDAWFERIAICAVPVVGALTGFEVSFDLAGITRAAVARLAAQGCRRLGFISWHGEEAFVEAVKNHGLATCEAWVRADLDPAVRGAGWEEFRDIWSAKDGRPDGLVILDDMLFADAQLAMFELGVGAPEDVRLAVLISSNASPPLRLPVTAFEIDPAEMAAALVNLLRQRLAGELTAPVTRYTPFREVAVQPDEGGRSFPLRERVS